MIDLRSDTLTLPSDEMLSTIIGSALGDSSRLNALSRGEDDTVNTIEDLAAELTGKDRAILFPSGTLANTTSILSYCKPGNKVLLDKLQHVYLSEKVVFSKMFGQLTPVFFCVNDSSKPDMDDIKSHLETGEINLICIENPHNFLGGVCFAIEELKTLSELAKANKVPIHMDGARLFNAAASLNVDVKEICKYVDSVMFCLSKGLGAPMGSLLCCNEDFSKKIIETKKMLGANMRQAGVIAAPGIYALENNIERMTVDNKLAYDVNRQLQSLKIVKAPKSVDSNIVMLDVSDLDITPSEFCSLAEDMGLLIRPVLEHNVRLVFHNGIDEKDAEEAVRIILEMDNLFESGRES